MVMKTIVHVLLIAAFATVPSRADKVSKKGADNANDLRSES